MIWWSSVDPRLSTLKPSIIHLKQMECCKSTPVFDFATSFYQLIWCHTRHTILFYKINTFTVQVTKMDACVMKQYEWKISILIIYPWILVTKSATSFWSLVAHRQDLVALASGRAVICNPVRKPYRQVCLQTKLWPWKVHQPNSRSKHSGSISGTWIEHVFAHCSVERKYVGCIELLFKVNSAICRPLFVFCLTMTLIFGVRTSP